MDPLDTRGLPAQRLVGSAIFLNPLGQAGLAAVTFRLAVPLAHQIVDFMEVGLAFTVTDGVAVGLGVGVGVGTETSTDAANFTTMEGSE